MTQYKHLLFIAACLCLLRPIAVDGLEKWSRQIEPTNPGVADSFDWVPLAQQADSSTKDRSVNARVLSYPQTYAPNARFGELPKHRNPPASAAHQHQFDFPFQFQRFPNAPQAQPLRQHQLKAPHHEPTSQSFFKFEMPFHNDGTRGGSLQPSLQTGYQIQHTFGGGAQATIFNSPLYNQPPVFPPEFHPIPQKPLTQHLQQKPLHQQNYIEDILPIKNNFRETKPLPTETSLQSVTPQVFPVDSQADNIFDLKKPSSFQSSPSTSSVVGNGGQQQDVQLLYVPYDSVYNQQQPQGPAQQNPAYEINKFNLNAGLPAVNPYQINQFYTQDPLSSQQPAFYSTSTTSRPQTTSAKPTNIFQSYASPPFTTAKPKPKAHQPPLSMFLLRANSRPTESDVVAALRSETSIAVIDAPTKQPPEIFVGPAGMPTPDGYAKFDLPYLSQLSHSRDLREVSFFVAPLSYRTPNGFNKILLPEPHVGSIVVNRAKDNYQATTAQPQQNFAYNTPQQNEVSQYQTTTQRPRLSGHRTKQPTSPKEYYQELLREPVQKTRNPFEITTQRSTIPPRGNKFNYFYDQDVIQEVTSPKMNKLDRPKKKRPQTVQIEQPAFTQTINNPYAQFKPMPNQISNDDYYKVQPQKPSTTSTSTSTTSTSTTSTTTSTTEPPTNYFTYTTNPQIEFQSTNGQLYHNFNTPSKIEEHVPRFTTRPPPATTADEEYRMKQYFRQQDAFRNRPQIGHPTNSPYEEVQYTPVAVEYDREVTIPSTTQKTSTKQRVTFYTPTATPASIAESNYNRLNYNNEYETQTDLPLNHRPSYNQNEILDGTVEYDPNPYQLPSELPALAPNLPGLVNNLQEKNKQNAIEQSTASTQALEPEPEPPTRPTRRPINRVRKPVVSKVTSSVSYSESESTSRRPSQRVRRPFGSRGTSSSSYSDGDETATTSTTTRRPPASRNPLIRNPNRIRYQPTPEERQTLRLKPKKHSSSSKKGSQNEDLEYQRDVLKQNYPVFKAASRRPTSPTAIPSSYAITTEGATSETQQVYTVTPSNNIDNDQVFPAGLLEPMQIAQQYNEYAKDNYGPGYFPNQEDLNPTEPSIRNEINPVYTTIETTTLPTTTTTTEEPQTTTRRSPFIRRNYPRLRTTTTEAPATSTAAPTERTTRARYPPRKVVRVRTRPRRPLHPASSTSDPQEDNEEEPKQNYRKVNRYNQDHYENDSPRRRYKQQFQLDGQESQWSPSLKNTHNNNFKPVDPKITQAEEKHNFENEPEIVTAGSEAGNDNQQKEETYEVNVSANFGPQESERRTTIKAPNLKPEKSFAELLEEVMGKTPDELATEADANTKTTIGTYFESQKTTVNNRLNRRGKWKKVRTSQNNENFETAESQNLGSQLYNSLYAGEKQKSTDALIEELRTTTPMTPATESTTSSSTQFTTSPPTTAAIDDYDKLATTASTTKFFDVVTSTTSNPLDELTTSSNSQDVTEETTTPASVYDDIAVSDDLETQSSLFSEVKKQLHDLFALDDNEDDHAVTAALEAVGRRRQDYTNIKRTKATEATASPTDAMSATTESTVVEDGKKAFHKNLMHQVVYATSTSTKVTSETEICYRGRCIKSEDLPPNHKLN